VWGIGQRLGLLALWGALLLGAALGVLRPLDDVLRDQRFGAATRSVSGDAVFVDIDSRSINAVGVWPWPRTIHAKVLDELMAMGAAEVIFDVDFSTASNENDDAAFERSLRDAGGYAMLAAFQQRVDASGAVAFNLPIERFRAEAAPVAVNVTLDQGGMVRMALYAMSIGGTVVPSAAAELAQVKGPAGTGFNIDFAIDPAAVDRVSVADILNGTLDASRIEGKQVIVGASALELKDFFVVPRHGVLPGALLQIVAAETLKQGRALIPLRGLPLVLAGLVAAIALVFARRLSLAGVVAAGVSVSVVIELAALLLQVGSAVLLDTAVTQVALAALMLQTLGIEVQRRGALHARASRERDANRRILDRVIEDNFDGVVVVNQSGLVTAASVLAEQMLGHGLVGRLSSEALPKALGDELNALMTTSEPGGQAPKEFVFAGSGDERILEYVMRRSTLDLPDGAANVACLTFRDITERRRTVDRLTYLGSHDQLTGAVSRLSLVTRIDELNRDGKGFAAVAVDLRRFRAINDTLGHTYGDALLKQVVSRLRSMGPDVVARLGGDSFVLIVPETDEARLRGFCETVGQWLSFPYELPGGHQAVLAVSAGAAIAEPESDADGLLSHADMALSAAKQMTGNGVALFAPEMDRRLQERQAVDAALRLALERGEFSLMFQPQVDLESGRVIGAEALIRWNHPELGYVSADRFIPVAEETGVILQIGRWVVEEACRQAMALGQINMAVNVSPVQFELSDVVADVQAALSKTGLEPSRLTIEITEGVFVGHSDRLIRQLQTLRAKGVTVALDDFGTGYSSLSYLGRLPLDKIKIDQGFVKRLPTDQEAIAIIRAVIELSNSLGKTTVAEGIETADQAWMLKMMSCKVGQGYHFGRPKTADDLREMLAEDQVAQRLTVSAA
jgi:diguanylate cyclase (GGDEF)-like protein